jgi:hypothetical protein
MNAIQYPFLHCYRTVTPLLGVQSAIIASIFRSITVQRRLMRGNVRKFDFQPTGNGHRTAGRMCEVGPPRKRDVPLHSALFAPEVLNGILPCGVKSHQRKSWK